MIREEIGRLPDSAADFYRHGAEAAAPHFAGKELGELFPADHRMAYDAEEVLGNRRRPSIVHDVDGGVCCLGQYVSERQV